MAHYTFEWRTRDNNWNHRTGKMTVSASSATEAKSKIRAAVSKKLSVNTGSITFTPQRRSGL